MTDKLIEEAVEIGLIGKPCDGKDGCPICTRFTFEGCPCDFHTKDLTEEQARITLFKPIADGNEAPSSVLVERFWHLWDARDRAIASALRSLDEQHRREVEDAVNRLEGLEHRATTTVVHLCPSGNGEEKRCVHICSVEALESVAQLSRKEEKGG